MVGACLSDIDLEVFHAGDLSADMAAGVTGHIESCGRCRAHYERFLGDQHVLGRMRLAARAAGTDLPSSFLSAHLAPLVPAVPPDLRGYEIRREIQRGGQGVVYEAVQLATRRTVALKILLEDPWADPQRRRRRFEAEIELAAGLRHPNIVTIHDSGLTEGHFYYAMEFVAGQRLGDYLESRRPSARACVQLFEPVCDALAYAHRHGVIHRDVKPSNISVDAQGVPHLLDFGLASRIEGQPGLERPEPASREFIGTLAYAAPEQVTGGGETVDTRSDVYALGVLLYQMVAGRLPYDVSGSVREVVHNIKTADPAPLEPAVVDRDLREIVLKALAKSPENRYRSAGHLLEDTRRYLRREPIEARQRDLPDVLGKWVGRHRLGVASGCAAAVLALLLGTWHLQAVRRERDQALVQRQAAEQVQRFLEQTLAAVPDAQDVDRTALLEMLGQAARRAQLEPGDDVLGQAAVHTAIGQTYRNLGDYDHAQLHLLAALEIFEKQLGAADPRVAEALSHLAQLRRREGQLEKAEQLQRRALSIMEQSGATPGDLAPYWALLATILRGRQDFEGAAQLYQQSLPLMTDPVQTADVQFSYATLLETQGRIQESEQLSRQALEIYRAYDVSVFKIAAVLANLSELRKGAGDLAQAESLAREALALVEKRLGRTSPRAAQIMSNLAAVLISAGRYAEAEELAREALELRRQLLGEDHPLVGLTLNILGGAQRQQGDLASAAATYGEALAILQAADDGPSLDVATTLNNLGSVRYLQGNHAEAQQHWLEALAIQQALLGESHADVAATLNHLGLASLKLGDRLDAQVRLLEALDLRRALLGEMHPDVAETLINIALLNRETGNLVHAETMYRQALDIQRTSLPADHPDIARTLNNVGLVLRRMGRDKEALQSYDEALAIYRAGQPPNEIHIASTLENIGYLLKQSGNPTAAAQRYREALDLRDQSAVSSGWQKALTQARLGECLMASAASEYAYGFELQEAESLLLAGFAGLSEALGPDDKLTQGAVQALVRLYEMLDRPDEAARYRAMLPGDAAGQE